MDRQTTNIRNGRRLRTAHHTERKSHRLVKGSRGEGSIQKEAIFIAGHRSLGATVRSLRRFDISNVDVQARGEDTTGGCVGSPLHYRTIGERIYIIVELIE